ncbi:hypothetical protein [Arsenicibacter rosenii]|uniref:Uncharacterized protein n=1 Tax=Arsenicibacter rosenii TaxID=1750698 RepID=A0A1S2VCU0_9BACT|nr:hypothetical protein [Arsenicibacter rosenii]OIN55748.1 hypothetical protein BLX24_28445 [Arsenicibacter rosenii]
MAVLPAKTANRYATALSRLGKMLSPAVHKPINKSAWCETNKVPPQFIDALRSLDAIAVDLTRSDDDRIMVQKCAGFDSVTPLQVHDAIADERKRKQPVISGPVVLTVPEFLPQPEISTPDICLKLPAHIRATELSLRYTQPADDQDPETGSPQELLLKTTRLPDSMTGSITVIKTRRWACTPEELKAIIDDYRHRSADLFHG